MQEEAATQAVEPLAQQRGKDQQVVVVYPHKVIVHADHLNQLVRKDLQAPLGFMRHWGWG